jgi:polyphosphate kinase
MLARESQKSTPVDAAPEEPPGGLDDPRNYINRELSLLRFHERVLKHAQDPALPLLERLRFLCISSTNLDEFFEIRVSGLKQQIALGLPETGPDGLSPQEIIKRVSAVAHRMVDEQYQLLNKVLFPAMAEEGIQIYRRERWTPAQQEWVKGYFDGEVLPVLTPVGLDPSHPFPLVLNKGLSFVVTLSGQDAFHRSSGTAVVQVPRSLPRLIGVPHEVAGGPHGFVLLSSVIHAHMGALFPGMELRECHQFRVTRNSDLWVDEEEVDDLLHALKGELPQRNFGDAVRMEVATKCSLEMSTYLQEKVGLREEDLYRVNGPVNLHRLIALCDLVDRPDLKYPPFRPYVPRALQQKPDMFEVVRQGDVVLHHPFESFSPVLELLRQAARDPQVVAIKQTLYRIGHDSPVASALLEAARNGKEVTAMVEVRARFDEAANIDLATRLQQVGANVAYGIVGHKAHAKLLLIVRREGKALRRYVHLGTGNYHVKTARAYTDVSYITCRQEIGEDVHDLFQQLTGLGAARPMRKLLQSPFTLHDKILELIDDEAEHARRGEPARILARMNALSEPRIIKALYRASQAGVAIDLLVRGICCLRPGVEGLSETIRVRSIVGRFLEHARVFHFLAGGEGITYCASADWMPRNLISRVEAAFPILEPELRKRVVEECLSTYLEDNTQTWDLLPDSSYRRLQPAEGEPSRVAQEILVDRVSGRRAEPATPADS